MPKHIFIIVACMVLLSCNNLHIPAVISLTSLKQTEFVPTLENKIADAKNTIYSPAFLYAWDEVRHLLNSPAIVTKPASEDLFLLNDSKSFKNSLADGQYQVNNSVEDGKVEASAFFNVVLPFPSKLQKIDEGILFGKQKVAAFGMKNIDDDIVKFSQVLYYQSDDNFIMKLIPKDTTQEILLVKGLQRAKTFSDAISQVNILIQNGRQDQLNHKTSWKYIFNPEDSFSIPVIRFNIETHYQTLERESFVSDNRKYNIATAYQRTALVFDENGAIVESEAMFAATDSVATPEKSHPKTMVFNKSFYIIIKRVDQSNPYFIMRIENAELLDKIK